MSFVAASSSIFLFECGLRTNTQMQINELPHAGSYTAGVGKNFLKNNYLPKPVALQAEMQMRVISRSTC